MSKNSRKAKRRKSRFHKRAAPGATPGTIVPSPDALKPVLDVIQFGPESYVEERITDLDSLAGRLSPETVTWVNVTGLGDAATIEKLGQIFSLHPLAMEDVVNVHQRPKVEDYTNHLFIVIRMLEFDDGLNNEQMSLFLGKDFVLTFQESPGDCLEPVRERLRKKIGRIRASGPDYLVYALLDAVVDAYFPIIEKYGDRIESLDDEIAEGVEMETFQQIHSTRNDLLLLHKIAWKMRDAVSSLVRDDSPFIAEDVHVFFRDCYDHTIQIIDVVGTYRELSSDLREFYLTQVANRTNDIMKFLTIIATIFIPLGFIAGLYGMNFNPKTSGWNMPELNWKYGYPFSLGLMFVVTLGLLVFFWRRGWLRS